jgi:hypothetical protein
MTTQGTENDRRHSERRTAYNGELPIWARVLWRYGIPGFIALYLVYQGSQGFGLTLDAIKDEQRTHVSETNFYLRQLCVFTAKTAGADPAACILPPTSERRP